MRDPALQLTIRKAGFGRRKFDRDIGKLSCKEELSASEMKIRSHHDQLLKTMPLHNQTAECRIFDGVGTFRTFNEIIVRNPLRLQVFTQIMTMRLSGRIKMFSPSTCGKNL